MKHLRNSIIFIFFSIISTYSQWVQTSNLNYGYISNPSFLTADIGYIVVGNSDFSNLKLLYTTNKGITWTNIWVPSEQSSEKGPVIQMINSLTGYVVLQSKTAPNYYIYVYKTIDGWQHSSSSMINQTLELTNGKLNLCFINDQTGFVSENFKVFKTVDFINWVTIFDANNQNPAFLIKDIKANNNILFLGGGYTRGEGETGGSYPKLFSSVDGGNSFYEILDNSNNGIGLINKMSLLNNNNDYYFKCVGDFGMGNVDYNNPTQLNWFANPYTTGGVYGYYDIIYRDLNTGYIYAIPFTGNDFKIGRTTNSGYGNDNFYNDYFFSGNSKDVGMMNIGDVILITESNHSSSCGTLMRKINIQGAYTFDLIPNYIQTGSWQFDDFVNGGLGVLNVPGTAQALGGSLFVGNTQASINNSFFYDWQSGSMNRTNGTGIYVDKESDYIVANYKTNSLTTSLNALEPAPQVKALKDTNNAINLCYESMGGIFFTRSLDNGLTFGTEEIVNYSPNENSGSNNYNPCLAEVKSYTRYRPFTDVQKNVACVWEHRDGNTVKIRFSERLTNSPPLSWSYPIDLVTLGNVPSGFNCFPKLFMAKSPFNGNYYFDSLLCVIYINPINGGQLWMFGRNFINQPSHPSEINYNIIPNNIGNNISSYSSDAIMDNYYPTNVDMDIHLAYAQNNKINYVHGRCFTDPVNFYLNTDESYEVTSGTTTWTSKSNPDITLRKYNNTVQPVVAYKGQYPVNIRTPNGPTTGSTYYPVVWRERLSGPTTWANASWNLTTFEQKNCNLEGSRASNSYFLNFWSGNPQVYGFNIFVPKWNGATNYRSTPSVIQTTDVKIMKGTIDRNAYNQQQVMTLSPSNNLFNVGMQTFQVSQSDPSNPGPDELNGVVVIDNLEYSFNLGCIIVNNQLIDFNTDGDSTLEDDDDFNNAMSSNPFLLHSYDTLIIGRNDFYLNPDSANNFSAITYSLNLVNNSTDKIFMTLEQDTIHLKDTVQLEYLEGFIIGEIPGGMGSDSFYVQIQIDTVWNVTGGGISGITGGFSAITGDGNRVHSFKDIVFFKNVKENHVQVPTRFNISQNYPNPFNPVTKINYDIPRPSQVSIKVYDIIGREVTSLVNEFKQPGYYSALFNGNNYASGVYFYRIQAADYTAVKKMVLIK